MPKVSVLIPTYNYGYFLDETIQSVLTQTFTDFELLIVDNCSTDNTEEVVRKYCIDKRVQFHRNKKNIGLVGNWNRCLELAKGEYIKFLCADDKFHPNLLERFVTVMDSQPDLAMVTSDSRQFGLVSDYRKSPFEGKVSGQTLRLDLLGPHNRLRNPTCVMFRKEHAHKAGSFNPELLKLLDREYYMRLLNFGDCFIVPEGLSYVRSHENRQSVFVMEKKQELIFESYRFVKSVARYSAPHSHPNAQELKAEIRKRAIRSAAVAYETLPRLYKKGSRANFKKAVKIGLAEKVLFSPLPYYFNRKILSKLLPA